MSDSGEAPMAEQEAGRGDVRVLFDVEEGRPACALLQAAAGATPGIASAFPSDTWLVSPTPDMRLLQGSPEDLRGLVEYATPTPEAESE